MGGKGKIREKRNKKDNKSVAYKNDDIGMVGI